MHQMKLGRKFKNQSKEKSICKLDTDYGPVFRIYK